MSQWDDNDSLPLLSFLFKDAFYANSKAIPIIEDCQALSFFVLEGAIRCEVPQEVSYPGPGGVKGLEETVSKYAATILHKGPEPEDNLLLKAFAMNWVGKHYSYIHGAFAFERSESEGHADLLSEDSKVWVECGAHTPIAVINVLGNTKRDTFLQFEKPLNRSCVRVWEFGRGQKFDRVHRSWKKVRSTLSGYFTKTRKGKYLPRYCENPTCPGKTMKYIPSKENQRVCSRYDKCKVWLRATPNPMHAPMPRQVIEQLLAECHDRDKVFHAFMCLAAETGLEKGTLVDLKYGQIVSKDTVVRTIEGKTRAGKEFSRTLSDKSQMAIQSLIDTKKGKDAFAYEDLLFGYKHDSYPNIKLSKLLKKCGLGSYDFNDIRNGTIARAVLIELDRNANHFKLCQALRTFGLSGESSYVNRFMTFGEKYRRDLV